MSRSSNPKIAPATATTGMDPSLSNAIISEVRAQLDVERRIIKDAFAFAAKIGGAALAILVTVFALFGIKTWSDIKKEVKESVERQALQIIQDADAQTGVKNTLNTLVNKAVVATSIVGIARNPGQEIELTASDWSRLRSWVKMESLEAQDFADALAVLNAQSAERKRVDVSRVLLDLVRGESGSQYQWVKSQPEKVDIVIDSFKHRDLGRAMTELVLSEKVAESTRVRAAAYIREVGYSEGIEKLLELIVSPPSGRLSEELLISVAVTKPSHVAARKIIDELVVTKANNELLARLLAELWWGARPVVADGSNVEITERRALISKLLDFSLRNGATFIVNSPRPLRDEFSRVLARRCSLQEVDPKQYVIFGYRKESGETRNIYELTFREFNGLNEYWTSLSDAAQAGDLESLRQKFPRSPPNFVGYCSSEVKIAISAAPESVLTINHIWGANRLESAGAKVLTFKSMSGPHLRPVDPLDREGIEIGWYESAGADFRRGRLVGIGGSKFSILGIDIGEVSF